MWASASKGLNRNYKRKRNTGVAKNKLKKFAEVNSFANVVQPQVEEVFRLDYSLKGKWNREFFRNDNPIVLELGCGKGEYTIGLAQRYPDKNFIGVDIKGARIWKGAKYALEKELQNVAFLRTHIEHITSVFDVSEVSEIWITFPDPQLKRIRIKKRLTSSVFLALYAQFLKPEGCIHLKTDNYHLYNYTYNLCKLNKLELKINSDDLYHSRLADDILSIRTHYESLFLSQGISIKYLKFSLNNNQSFEEPLESEDDT